MRRSTSGPDGRGSRRPDRSTPGRLAAAAALGYVAGLFPSADVAARLAAGGETDLRAEGSGNPGAANAGAVLGKRWGLAVMAADVAKAAAAAVGGRRIAGETGAHVAGTAAVVGHCFPAHNGFRGGKGVAASVGQVVATFPAYFPIDAGVAVATAVLPWWRRRAFAAIVASSTCWVIGGVVWSRSGWGNAWGPEAGAALPIASAASSAVILYKFVEAQREAAPIGTESTESTLPETRVAA